MSRNHLANKGPGQYDLDSKDHFFMEQNKKPSSRTGLYFGKVPGGTYSDITIEIELSDAPGLHWASNIEMEGEDALKAIEREFVDQWIEPYHKRDGINLSVTILHVGVDPTGRKYTVHNSVGGVMHKACLKLALSRHRYLGCTTSIKSLLFYL